MLPTFRGVPRSPPASDPPSLSPLVGEGLPRDVSCSSSLRREPRASHWGRAAPRPGWAGLAFGATSLALCPAVPPRRPPPAPRAPSLSSCLNSVLLHTEASPAMLRRPSQKSRLLPPSAPASRRPTPGRAARGLHHWPCSLLHAAHGHCPRHTGAVLKCPPLFSTWSSATAFCVECPPSGPS